MSPTTYTEHEFWTRVPRASGDEPYVHYTTVKLNKCSPRERG